MVEGRYRGWHVFWAEAVPPAPDGCADGARTIRLEVVHGLGRARVHPKGGQGVQSGRMGSAGRPGALDKMTKLCGSMANPGGGGGGGGVLAGRGEDAAQQGC